MPRYEVGLIGSEHTALIDAATSGKAKYRYFLDIGDCYPDLKFTQVRAFVSQRMTEREKAEQEAAGFNSTHKIGEVVEYWTGIHEGNGRTGRLRTGAIVMSSNNVVVWVEDYPACISITHVAPAAAMEAA